MSLRQQHLLAPAKINTFLEIIAQRDDGFHELETIFQCIDLADEIDIVETDAHRETRIVYTNAAMSFGEQDICWRAAELMRQHKDDIPGLEISITKHIPVGAGLGGASSDAAAIIKTLATWYNLEEQQLHDFALRLGSDVPFFLHGGCAYARGRGEVLEALQPIIQDPIYLIIPPQGLETAAVFAALSSAERGPRQAIGADTAQQRFANRLEAASRRLSTELDDLFQQATDKGLEIHMSGSGSACFAFDPLAENLEGVRVLSVKARN